MLHPRLSRGSDHPSGGGRSRPPFSEYRMRRGNELSFGSTASQAPHYLCMVLEGGQSATSLSRKRFSALAYSSSSGRSSSSSARNKAGQGEETEALRSINGDGATAGLRYKDVGVLLEGEATAELRALAEEIAAHDDWYYRVKHEDCYIFLAVYDYFVACVGQVRCLRPYGCSLFDTNFFTVIRSQKPFVQNFF